MKVWLERNLSLREVTAKTVFVLWVWLLAPGNIERVPGGCHPTPLSLPPATGTAEVSAANGISCISAYRCYSWRQLEDRPAETRSLIAPAPHRLLFPIPLAHRFSQFPILTPWKEYQRTVTTSTEIRCKSQLQYTIKQWKNSTVVKIRLVKLYQERHFIWLFFFLSIYIHSLFDWYNWFT